MEYEPTAAEAFKKNNPEATVFCNNCNVLLRVRCCAFVSQAEEIFSAMAKAQLEPLTYLWSYFLIYHTSTTLVFSSLIRPPWRRPTLLMTATHVTTAWRPPPDCRQRTAPIYPSLDRCGGYV